MHKFEFSLLLSLCIDTYAARICWCWEKGTLIIVCACFKEKDFEVLAEGM